MKGDRERMRDIFDQARRMPASDRAAFLDGLAVMDAPMRGQIEDMLAALDEAGSFLSKPTRGAAGDAPATMAAPLHEGPGTRIGPYRLLQRIGEGGFGSVFMAEQEKPVARKIALKIIKLGMDTRAVIARFEAERQALAMMDHPNIARVLDAGATETGRPYFVMELVKGDPIVEYCDKNNLSIEDRLELFAQVCQAVQHAHTKGIIHRDIKPSNILVATQDDRPHAKVIDFGIAKATASKLTEKTLFTEHRQLIGTPEYMSPEQAEGSLDIDTRTDVYSLGVLLYELLTGTTPFSGKELRSVAYAEIQRIIREVEPPKPSTRLSSLGETAAKTAQQRRADVKKLGTIVRGDLDWIVMKALEKDRQRRYETANGLAMDVRRYLAREVVLAAPPSTAYRMRKFVHRHRAQVAAAGLVGIALLLGLAGTAWQAKVASDRAEAAKKAEGEARAARDAEKARADELKKVSDFQANMLSQVDPTTAGVRLTEDVNRRFAAALEKAKVPEGEREGLVDAFRRNWARVNATDAATALIDETILKPAVRAIDEQFKDQPIVDAQLRQALADRYCDLGLYDAAFPLADCALKTRRGLLGDKHPDTLGSVSNMGDLLQKQGKLAQAEPYYREAMEKYRRFLGEEHPDTLSSINNMGFLLQKQGKPAQAEPYYREALEKRRRVLGEEHPDTLDSINSMGALIQEQGELAQAEPYFREVLEKRRRVLGEEHPHTLGSINNLSMLLRAQGKLAEAEPLSREALEKYRRVRGEEHPDTLSCLNNMGMLLRDRGRLAEAEPFFREALEKRGRVLGEEHPDTLSSIGNMGSVLRTQGKLAEAEPYYHEALEKFRRVLGEEHPRTLTSINNMGMLLRDRGKHAESEAVLGEGLGICQRVFPGPHPTTALLLHHHAYELSSLGRLDDAAAEAHLAMDMYRDHPDWSPAEAAHAASIVALILTAQGRPDEALAARRECLAVQRRNLPPGSAELSDKIEALGLELLKRGTLETAREAEPLLRECLEIRVKVVPEGWPVSLARSLLGAAILALADVDTALTPEARATRLREAESLLLGGYVGLKDNPALPIPAKAGGHRLREVVERIVHLYEIWDRAEPGKGYDVKAAEWKAKLQAAPPVLGQK